MKDNPEELKKFIDNEDNLILNTHQNKVLSVYMIIGNISLTIVLFYVIINYKDNFLGLMVIVGISSLGLAFKMVLDIMRQHDIVLITTNKLRKDYIREQKAKEKEIIEKELRKVSKIKAAKQLDSFKEEVHNSAVNG